MEISTPQSVVLSSPVSQQCILGNTTFELTGYVVVDMPREGEGPVGKFGQGGGYPASLPPNVTYLLDGKLVGPVPISSMTTESPLGLPEVDKAIFNQTISISGADGAHTITVKATNAAGGTVEATVTVVLMNWVPQPDDGFKSNHNYYLYSGVNPATQLLNPIMGLTVTVTVTEEMVASRNFSFQLNAIGQPGGGLANWQQYCMSVTSHPRVSAVVNLWLVGEGDYIPGEPHMVTLSSFALAVGDQLSISPNCIPPNETVTSATCIFISGSSMFSKEVNLLNHIHRGQLITIADLAPIVAFQFNIVGNAGHSTEFSSAAGTITYTALSPLLVSEHVPPAAEAEPWMITGETSNIYYGPLPSAPCPSSNTLTQTFNASKIWKPGSPRLEP